ncbi:MAG TPA: thiamine phosphate synthase [Pseudolabrys sp.]|nr:thiamine phosphate synthase [Pseudolabrys sp.]
MTSRPKQPTPRPAPRLYLITPPVVDASIFGSLLSAALDAGDIAAILLRLADADERTLINRAKALCSLAQGRGAALLLDGHFELVARAGADGGHMTGIASFTEAIGQLKPERIAGAGGMASRHDAMLAAEQGADYVMFGEPDVSGKCPAFAAVEERVEWWAEVFQIPCIGYAPSLDGIAPLVSAGADFIALGDVVWRDPSIIANKIREAGDYLQLPEAPR